MKYGFVYNQPTYSTNGVVKFNTDIADAITDFTTEEESLTIVRCNKNFLSFKNSSGTYHGCSIKSYTDNTIICNGTKTSEGWMQSIIANTTYLPKGSFRLTVAVLDGSVTPTGSYAPIRVRVASGLMSSYMTVANETKSTTFINGTAGSKTFEIGIARGEYTNYKVQVQVEFVSEDTSVVAPSRTVISYPASIANLTSIVGTNYVFTTNGTDFTLKYPTSANSKLGDIDTRVTDAENEIDNFDNLFYQSNYVENFNASQYVRPFTNLLVSATGKSDAFLWFTDPHVLNDTNTWETQYRDYIECLHRTYLLTPTSFTLCGGDWLTAKESDTTVAYKLGLCDGRMKKDFFPYYPVFGNHDNNEQGTVTLTQNQIVNLMFQQEGKAYYAFNTPQATYFVLDSGTDHSNGMTVADRWAQILWVSTSGGYIIPSLIENAQLLCDAYNNHTTITLNSISYDFTSATGKVRYMIGGHSHNDKIWESDATTPIPMVITANLKHLSGVTTPTFDLMVADYGAGVLKSVRIGSPFLDDSTTTGITLTMA